MLQRFFTPSFPSTPAPDAARSFAVRFGAAVKRYVRWAGDAIVANAWSVGAALSAFLHISLLVGVGAVFGFPGGWGSERGGGSVTYVSVVEAAGSADIQGAEPANNRAPLRRLAQSPKANRRASPSSIESIAAGQTIPPDRAAEPVTSGNAGASSTEGSAGRVGGGGAGAGTGKRGIISAPAPTYPLQARRAGFEGRVVLDVVVAPNGRVASAAIVRSSGRADCDESAKDTIAERWVFDTALLAGFTTERVSVAYRLE